MLQFFNSLNVEDLTGFNQRNIVYINMKKWCSFIIDFLKLLFFLFLLFSYIIFWEFSFLSLNAFVASGLFWIFYKLWLILRKIMSVPFAKAAPTFCLSIIFAYIINENAHVTNFFRQIKFQSLTIFNKLPSFPLTHTLI